MGFTLVVTTLSGVVAEGTGSDAGSTDTSTAAGFSGGDSTCFGISISLATPAGINLLFFFFSCYLQRRIRFR